MSDTPSDQESKLATLPRIEVIINPDGFTPILKFDSKVFQDWDFIIAILDAAKSRAEDLKRMSQIAQMQQAQMEQAQAQMIQRRIQRG